MSILFIVVLVMWLASFVTWSYYSDEYEKRNKEDDYDKAAYWRYPSLVLSFLVLAIGMVMII